jgi:hypothetical protein
VTATVTAAPVSVTWNMGDGGQPEVCSGPGEPYQPSLPSIQQGTLCSYTYKRSSFGQPTPDGNPNDAAYPIVATIEWSVSWTSSVGQGGSLPPLYTSSSAHRRVEQIESVESAS